MRQAILWCAVVAAFAAWALPVRSSLAQTDLRTGIVAYYDFEETAGSVLVDRSGGGNLNNADVVDAPPAVSAAEVDLTVTGKIGSAVRTPGTHTEFISIDATPGAALGGAIIGIVENLFGFYISTSFKSVVPFAAILIMLAVKPSGLLARHYVKKV